MLEHSTSKESRKTRRLSLEAIVKAFGLTGEHSLMIEGGASVISTILATYASSSFCNLDRVIVTIAPTYVGEDGIAIRLEKEGTIGSMQPMASKSFGRDVVIAYDFTNEG